MEDWREYVAKEFRELADRILTDPQVTNVTTTQNLGLTRGYNGTSYPSFVEDNGTRTITFVVEINGGAKSYDVAGARAFHA